MRRLITVVCCLLTFGFTGISFAVSGPEFLNLRDIFEIEGKKKDVMLPITNIRQKSPVQAAILVLVAVVV